MERSTGDGLPPGMSLLAIAALRRVFGRLAGRGVGPWVAGKTGVELALLVPPRRELVAFLLDDGWCGGGSRGNAACLFLADLP